MGKSSRIAAFCAAALAFAAGVQALPKVHRDGRYLYSEDGSRFYIKGVAYQPQGEVTTSSDNPFLEPSSFIDPLADGDGCKRDAPFLQQLGVNVIRVYSVDSTLNHDACMSALSSAGIYTMIDLSLPLNGSIDRVAPAWSTNILDLYLNTINVFSKYDNILGYNVGNEVVTSANGTATAAFIKAAARDVKAYLNSKSLTSLVGYAAIDADTAWLVPFAEYLSCDPTGKNDGSTSIDIFGLNNYEWCGDAQPSVYNSKNTAFQDYNVAAYFSEYGCIFQPPRLWTEVAALFSSPMTDIWSGGIAFSYFPAQSAQGQFGMVTISGNQVTTSDDFDRLKTQYGQVSPPNSPTASGSTTFPTCPAEDGTNQLASTNLPPTPNQKTCDCVVSALACRFDPKTTNTSVIVGTLLDEGCGLLGQNGGSCDSISADGAAGKYGAVSFCDPSTKLSYVMDQFYEATNRNKQSCDFGGNATIVSTAPSDAPAVSAAVSSCLSGAIGTFVPQAPSTTASGGNGAQNTNTAGSGSGSGNSGANGAMSFGSQQAWVGAFVATAFSIAGAALVLA